MLPLMTGEDVSRVIQLRQRCTHDKNNRVCHTQLAMMSFDGNPLSHKVLQCPLDEY